MICEIGGEIVQPELVYFREPKFGTDAPGYQILPYRLSATHDELFSAFDEYYNEYARDDETYGMNESDIDVSLRKLGWPSLRELVSVQPKLLEAFLSSGSLPVSLLQELFAPYLGPPEQYLYLVNSISRVSVAESSIELSGDVIHVRTHRSK